ncbi:MFS transporter [Streptomyces boninensis]|uniref:MFS transporter n=1 Tax=Streptomyces boninensis TaxID=2039455 RepID=UPI003B21571F
MTTTPHKHSLRKRPHLPTLLRSPPFRRYWTGQTISVLGDEISAIAMPATAVLLLDAGSADMGWLTASVLLPSLFFSIPAGAWADRRRSRRRVMLLADLGRFLLLCSIPLAYVLDALTLPQLYVASFAVGTLAVLFDVCAGTLYVSLLKPAQYVDGAALLHGSRSLARVAGPGTGGALVSVLTAPVAVLADALSYLASAACLARISPPEPPPAAPQKGHLTAGLAWLARHPVMRPTLLAFATLNFFNFIFQALFFLYANKELGLSPGFLGAVMSAGAIGGLAGAAAAGRIVRRFGYGPVITGGFVGFAAPLMLIPAASGPQAAVIALLFLAYLGASFGVMVVDITANAFQAALIPDDLRSRVLGAFRTVNYGVRPLGALAGGGLGTVLGLRPTLWIATAGALLGILWLLPSPLPRMRELPAPTSPEPGAPAPAPDQR